MRPFSLKNWAKTPDMDCLLFFAQRLMECVFNYTSDSYKSPALYSSSLCREAVDMFVRIEREEFSEKSIDPILVELKKKLHQDPVVILLIGENLDDYLSFDSTNFREAVTKLKLVHNKIRPDLYVRACQKK